MSDRQPAGPILPPRPGAPGTADGLTRGLLLALLAYASFSWGDACIKALGGGLSIFAIGFFATLFAGLFLLFSRPSDERWRDFWRMRQPWLVQARAVSGLGAGIFGVYAFTTIPLAEAYALIFLSPLLITLLSILVLDERVGGWRWASVLTGFAGVLMVVRPGFRALELGHLAALGIAVTTAATVLLLRSLADREKRTTLLGVMICYSLLFNGAAALATGGGAPAPGQLGLLVLVGGFSAAGQLFLLLATRSAPASRIAPTQYSQIAWAAGIGALVFGEVPDAVGAAGLALVAGAGLLTLVGDPGRLGRWRS